MKLLCAMLACLALSGCTARVFGGGLAVCIGVKTCTIEMTPESPTAAQQIGGGLAQAAIDYIQNRGR